MRPSALLTNATLALALIASALVQVALGDRRGSVTDGLIELAFAAALAGAIGWLDRRRGSHSNWAIGAAFALLFTAPIATSGLGGGVPYEVALVGVLRNLMLGLAMLRSEARAQAVACLASLFLVLFAFLWTMNPATIALLVAYAVLGMWWLLGAYWDRLSGRVAHQSERAIPVGPAGLAIALGLVGTLLAVPLARTSRLTTALNGFMPSSGGTSWSDDRAYGGIGDGDQMVKARDQASSFGPIESELFLESEMPSLYDVFNEFSDPPTKKKQSRKRAIPLAPNLMQQNHTRRGKTEQAGREFEAIRRRPRSLPKTTDRRSDALLYITGRVPVHLALEAYDLWDGRTLSHSGADARVAVKLDNLPDANGNRWLRPSRTLPAGLFTHADSRALKIINLKTSTVPAPPHTDALLLDKAHTVTLFGSTVHGDLRLDIESIPQLTTLHLRSWARPAEAEPELVLSSPEASSERLAALAARWTEGVPRGWRQVQAVCDQLQAAYEHDPEAVAPEACDDAVEHFLFEAKRGPDYLFATSAAVLLRTLGYETRVRSGFYARASNFNVLARATPVFKEDAHFWTEVRAAGGSWFDPDGKPQRGAWLTLEPTPGYRVLHEPTSVWSRLAGATASAWRAVAEHPAQSTLIAAAMALVGWLRAPLADRLVTLWWLLVSRFGGARQTTLATLRLVRRRAWLRGRPVTGTLGRWELFPDGDDAQQQLRRDFVEIASWALYGGGEQAVAPASEVRRVCGGVARRALRPASPLPSLTKQATAR